MAKTRTEKERIVQELTGQMQDAQAVVFADIQKLKIKDTDELRRLCREQGITMLVTKKTLLNKALQSRGIAADGFTGGVCAFFGTGDEVAPAQVVAKFAKKHDIMTLFGGILEGAFIDAAKVSALSKLPGKQELLARLVGTLNAPVSGFVNVLAGNIRGLVNVLTAVKDSKA